MIYIVLGMHKSGTTLIAQLLHEAGIHMGQFQDGLGYDQDNTYERHETQMLNRQLLHGCLIPSLGYLLRRHGQTAVNRAGYHRNQDSTALVRFSKLQTVLQRPETAVSLRQLVATLNGRFTHWGFKDPRTCLTYPAWREAIGDHKRIMVFRSYTQLLRHYRVHPANLPLLFRVLYAWTLHNRCLLSYVQQAAAPTLLLSYEALMQGEVGLQRLAAFVERPLTDQRNPILYRHRETIAPLPATARILRPFLPGNPETIYQQLQTLHQSHLLPLTQPVPG